MRLAARKTARAPSRSSAPSSFYILFFGGTVTTLTCAITRFLDSRIGIVSVKTARINKGYLRSLVEFFGEEQMVETLTVHHLRTWRAWLFERECKYVSVGNDGTKRTWRPEEKGPLSVHTIHGMVRTCRQFFRWLHTEEILATNPAQRLELPPLPKEPPKAISDTDIAKMLDVARASTSLSMARDVALIWFLRDTGCRLGGAATARLSDLDLDTGTVIVREKGRGGQHVARAAFLNVDAVKAMRVWLAERPCALQLDGSPLTDAIFVNSRYPFTALTTGAIYRRIKDIAQAAGVYDHSNPHAFRHGLARRMLQNGAPLGAVSRILGHADIRTTDTFYGVYLVDELKKAHEKYA